MLTISDLTFTYPGRRHKTPVLSHLSYSTESGRMVFVLGPNGSGKSTLFRLILKLLPSKAGAISVDGRDLSTFGQPELARIVCHIPQQLDVTFNYTVYDTVMMGRTSHMTNLANRPGPKDHRLATQAIRTLGIENLAGRGMRDLSGGERQLVFIARALCQGGKILLFDEPTSNLDYANAERVLEEMRRLADSGFLVLSTSHEPTHALQYGDELVLLKNGELLAAAGPKDITTADLSELYGTDIRLLSAQDAPQVRIAMTASELHASEARQ